MIVFIAGASGVGKSMLRDLTLEELHKLGLTADFICMDNYCREIPEGKTIEDFRKETNFDSPDILDLNSLKAHINEWIKKNPIQTPKFKSKIEKCTGKRIILPTDVLIVEGIHAFYFVKHFLDINDTFFYKVFIETDTYRDIVDRRIVRNHLNQGSEKIKGSEKKNVGPAFFRLICSTRTLADYFVDNSIHVAPALPGVLPAASTTAHPLRAAAKEIAASIEEKRNALVTEVSPPI